MSAENTMTEAATGGSTEYINHHLHFWQVKVGDSTFMTLNVDTLFFTLLLSLLFVFFFLRASRKATAGVPGKFQALVEIVVGFVDGLVRETFHGRSKLIAPLSITIFLLVFLMNFMDMLPVDALPALWAQIYGAAGHDPSHAYLRVVPTADLSTTLGLAFAVLILRFWYSVKIKGAGGWAHELVSAPFGTSKNPIFALILGVINVLMQIIEYVANTVSHGMRLFGNMYAGELVFMLIALMGGAAALSLSGVLLPVGHVIAGTIWTLFHILVITLQAFIFMMLSLIYLGQAHNAH